MDTGKGYFEQVQAETQGVVQSQAYRDEMKALEERYPQHGGWFREGEIVEIRGSRFRIQSVKPNQLRLKLLPR